MASTKAEKLLADLRRAGVTPRLSGNFVRFDGAVPPDMLVELAAVGEEIAEFLGRQAREDSRGSMNE